MSNAPEAHRRWIGRWLAACLSVTVVVVSPTPARAHPEGFSGMQVGIEPGLVRVAITIHTRDMGGWFSPAAYPDYVADVTAAMQAEVDEIVELQIDGEPQPVAAATASQLEVGLLELLVEYPLPPLASTVEVLVWSKHLIRLPRGHQQLLFVEDHRDLQVGEQAEMLLDDVLSVDRDAAAWFLAPAAAAPPPAVADQAATSDAAAAVNPAADMERERAPKAAAAVEGATSRISFFRFGIEHILGGYDHLLFLAALLLVTTTFREAASIVTCFTVAHSITLALAALDVVRLPAAIVEPVIALSIACVAIENFWGEPPLRRRMVVTFAFGLIHGLGFATALREIGLGTIPGGVVVPLLSFNLGVEAGQLCVAAVLFPLIRWARACSAWAAAVVPVGSALIAAAGLYWLVTRVAANVWGG